MSWLFGSIGALRHHDVLFDGSIPGMGSFRMSEPDVYGRQILTSIVYPRTERVNVEFFDKIAIHIGRIYHKKYIKEHPNLLSV